MYTTEPITVTTWEVVPSWPSALLTLNGQTFALGHHGSQIALDLGVATSSLTAEMVLNSPGPENQQAVLGNATQDDCAVIKRGLRTLMDSVVNRIWPTWPGNIYPDWEPTALAATAKHNAIVNDPDYKAAKALLAKLRQAQ